VTLGGRRRGAVRWCVAVLASGVAAWAVGCGGKAAEELDGGMDAMVSDGGMDGGEPDGDPIVGGDGGGPAMLDGRLSPPSCPPRDGGAGTDASGGDGGAEDDGAVDAVVPPPLCEPAACEDSDGGIYQPAWGCPAACDPPCEGDTMCCEGTGACMGRRDCYGDCEEELTISPILLIGGFPVSANVCNRGSRAAGYGQVVRFEEDGQPLCDGIVCEDIAPCECARVTCDGRPRTYSTVRATIKFAGSDGSPACGNPLGLSAEIFVLRLE
jgi:hypothetical protein